MNMTDVKKGKNDRSRTYKAPKLIIYGTVGRLTASGTQGGTENQFNGDPQPRNKP